MLKVNVGLSKKLSKDFNSSGFSINVEGEVTAAVSDPEAVIEEVKQLYDLAEESLAVQVERSKGDAAIASRDAQAGHGTSAVGYGLRGNGSSNTRTSGNGQAELATNKQVQYLLSIGKRQRLSTVELEHRIEEILGRKVGVYDLTKRDAGQIIEALTGNGEKQQSFRR